MATEETLRLRQRDGKRIGFIRTHGKSLEDFLLPLKCAVLSATTCHGFALTAMVEILQLWRTYELTQDQSIYKKYHFLKTKWQNTRDGVDEKKSYAPNLHMLVKNNQDPWELKEIMELQDLLTHDQLLIVEVKPVDHACHFLFVGPPAESVILLLKDGDRFHGVKDHVTFFQKYCDFQCCC